MQAGHAITISLGVRWSSTMTGLFWSGLKLTLVTAALASSGILDTATSRLSVSLFLPSAFRCHAKASVHAQRCCVSANLQKRLMLPTGLHGMVSESAFPAATCNMADTGRHPICVLEATTKAFSQKG